MLPRFPVCLFYYILSENFNSLHSYVCIAKSIIRSVEYVIDILQASGLQDIHEAVIQLEASAAPRLLIE